MLFLLKKEQGSKEEMEKYRYGLPIIPYNHAIKEEKRSFKDYLHEALHRCPSCKGIQQKFLCSTCNGTGKID